MVGISIVRAAGLSFSWTCLVGASLWAQPAMVVQGNGEGFPPEAMQPLRTGIGAPSGLAVGPHGATFVSAAELGCVFRIEGNSLRMIAGWCIRTASGPGAIAMPYSQYEEGRPARAAQLRGPSGLAVDAQGNIYVAETEGHRVRRIDVATGFIRTVAGTGRPGHSSDGGSATDTAFDHPVALVFDKAGNLYVAQDRLSRVRRIDAATRIVTTVAGNGVAGLSGDGGPGDHASLSLPSGLATDGLDLFVADRGNESVRAVNLRSGVIRTAVGGLPQATGPNLKDPIAVALGPGGKLFVADVNGHRVLAAERGGLLTSLAGTGRPAFEGDGRAARKSSLNAPVALATEPGGGLLIADSGNRRVRAVKAGVIRTVVGEGGIGYVADGKADQAFLRATGFAFDGRGNVYIADGPNHRVRLLDVTTGMVSTIAGNGIPGFGGDDGPAKAALLNDPQNVTIDAAGNVYIADSDNGRVRRIDRGSRRITTVVGNGRGPSPVDGTSATAVGLQHPVGLAIGPDGSLFVSDRSRVLEVDVAANTIRVVGAPGGGPGGGQLPPRNSMMGLAGLAVDRKGRVFVFDEETHRVYRVDPITGAATVFAGNGIEGFTGDGGPAVEAALGSVPRLALDARGDLLLPDPRNKRLRIVDPSTGVISTRLSEASPGLKDATGFAPVDIRLNASGDPCFISAGRIQCLGAPGLVTMAGGGRGF